jgi:acyl-CoA thioesterase-1
MTNSFVPSSCNFKRLGAIACFLSIAILLSCEQQKQMETPRAEAAQRVDPAPPPPSQPDARPVVVAFGDSLTAGYGVETGYSYPDFLQKDLDRAGYRYHVVNAGISGDTTSGGLARADTVAQLKPAVVILELGGNDGLRGTPLSSTRANLEQIIVSLQKSGTRVVLAGITLPPNYGPDYIKSFESIYKDLSVKYKLPLIPFLLQGAVGVPGMMQRDGIHATVQGNEVVANLVMRTLKPLL